MDISYKCNSKTGLSKNVEVIQAEIVGHGDLYLCAVFLTVHDKLTCEVSSTWTKWFVYVGPKRKR